MTTTTTDEASYGPSSRGETGDEKQNLKKKKLILAVNAGSSSLKISVYKLLDLGGRQLKDGGEFEGDSEPVVELCTASFAGISVSSSSSSKDGSKSKEGGHANANTVFSFSSTNDKYNNADDGPGKKNDIDVDHNVKKKPLPEIKSHEDGFVYFLKFLRQTRMNRNDASEDEDEDVGYVCHRVVHGGGYPNAVIITDETYHHIERLSDLAPLHNGSALAVIKAAISHLPNSNSIAFFDSAFHNTLPRYISCYAIDPVIAEKKGLRKYGFHGLSYSYILRTISSKLQKPPSETTLIACHLGSGASVCAIRNGQSLDTSMGLTPLSGLPGGTRAGSVDPSLIFHYTSHAGKISHGDTKGMHITEAENILNKKSGFLALTGTTDFAIIAKEAFGDGDGEENGKEKFRLAYDIFVDRIVDFIAAYYVKLGGAENIDALVFAGGIGERSVILRETVVEKVGCLGFVIDKTLNGGVDDVEGEVVLIGESESGGNGSGKNMKTFVCRTDEQIEMARQCVLHGEFAR